MSTSKKMVKSKEVKRVILLLGVFLVVTGTIVIISSITIVEIQPMKLTYNGPFGSIDIDSLTPEQEQRILVGFIIASFGVILIKTVI